MMLRTRPSPSIGVRSPMRGHMFYVMKENDIQKVNGDEYQRENEIS